MGVLTACAGGILRDVLANEPSILMRPELYVTAAALSSALFVPPRPRRHRRSGRRRDRRPPRAVLPGSRPARPSPFRAIIFFFFFKKKKKKIYGLMLADFRGATSLPLSSHERIYSDRGCAPRPMPDARPRPLIATTRTVLAAVQHGRDDGAMDTISTASGACRPTSSPKSTR